MQTGCIVIGAGHSGLAVSHCLSGHGIEHVIIERGEVANSWKKERWDSLRLLTPNWQASLPGFAYDGDEPDGFLTMPETISFIEDYATHISAPVQDNTEVQTVSENNGIFAVQTSNGKFHSRSLVIASGACNIPSIPAFADNIPESVSQISPIHYRNPDQLEDGGVLVVGASASGLQIAEEIHLSGRPVTISVGEHVRLPRVYRGRDIQWWMHVSGILDEDWKQIDDLVRARNIPSPQLVGTPERSTLDLNRMVAKGVILRGRLAGINEGKAQFSGSLKNNCALADLKMNRLLNTIDEWATENGLDGEVAASERYDETITEEAPPLLMDLQKENIKTVVWATGYRSDYSWLDIPVLDRKGKIKHEGGVVTEVPGMYLIGTTFLRRRKSTFIHGAEDDATEICEHLSRWYKQGG